MFWKAITNFYVIRQSFLSDSLTSTLRNTTRSHPHCYTPQQFDDLVLLFDSRPFKYTFLNHGSLVAKATILSSQGSYEKVFVHAS